MFVEEIRFFTEHLTERNYFGTKPDRNEDSDDEEDGDSSSDDSNDSNDEDVHGNNQEKDLKQDIAKDEMIKKSAVSSAAVPSRLQKPPMPINQGKWSDTPADANPNSGESDLATNLSGNKSQVGSIQLKGAFGKTLLNFLSILLFGFCYHLCTGVYFAESSFLIINKNEMISTFVFCSSI